MHVRRATIMDIPRIQEIAHATWPAVYGNLLVPGQVEYMLLHMYATDELERQLSSDQYFYYLGSASPDTKAVGFAALEINVAPHLAKLHKIYVLPAAHGLGLGRALMSAATQTAQEANQARLRLDVNRHNSAIAFYERLGFTKVTAETIDIGKGYEMCNYVYERLLDEAKSSPRQAQTA